MTALGLTPRQAELLSFIADYRAEHAGASPSYDEMAAGIGLAAKSNVHRLIVALEERGCISRLPRRARSLAVTERAA